MESPKEIRSVSSSETMSDPFDCIEPIVYTILWFLGAVLAGTGLYFMVPISTYDMLIIDRLFHGFLVIILTYCVGTCIINTVRKIIDVLKTVSRLPYDRTRL
jgi:hypothetical protein